MNIRLYLILLFLYLHSIGNAQQHLIKAPLHHGFFKTIPPLEVGTPHWARMMYSHNPNVFQVDSAYERYYLTHIFQKNTHTQNYKHWRRRLAQNNFINAQGFIDIPSQKEQEASLQHYRQQLTAKINAGNWSLLGPVETNTDGANTGISAQTNVYSFDQSLSNPNVLYCGTETGAIFKSTNKGDVWGSVGDDW